MTLRKVSERIVDTGVGAKVAAATGARPLEIQEDDPRLSELRRETSANLFRHVNSNIRLGMEPADAIRIVREFLGQRLGGLIPPLDSNGVLPVTHPATLDEIHERFGTMTERRIRLWERLELLADAAKNAQARRLMLGGSFVTSKPEPRDLDIVLLVPPEVTRRDPAEPARLPASHPLRIAAERLDVLCHEAGDELQLFLEYDEGSFLAWFRLFSQVREPPPHLKGVLEVIL